MISTYNRIKLSLYFSRTLHSIEQNQIKLSATMNHAREIRGSSAIFMRAKNDPNKLGNG